MSYFLIESDNEFVIYGAGGDCRRLIAVLQQNDYHISAIIDKRASTIGKIDDIPVYSPEDYNVEGCAECIFIISIKNVFEHTSIAIGLLRHGAKKIIYKPLPTLYGIIDDEWDSISKAYDKLLIEKKIPEFEIAITRGNHITEYRNQLLIDEKGEEILCFLPIELVHNYNADDTYGKMHMAAYYPLIDLYKYLLGTMSYLDWDEIKEEYYLYAAEWVDRVGEKYTTELRKSLIHSRCGAFQEMQKIADIDRDFFRRNAVNVEIGDYKQFYLNSSGRNRVAFLIAKGCNFIPVKMSREAYEEWIDEKKTKKIIERFEAEGLSRVPSGIPHPILSSIPADLPEYTRLFCMTVLSRIHVYLHHLATENKQEFNKVNYDKLIRLKNNTMIFCDIEDMGNIGRYIATAGLHCKHWCVENEEFVDLLDDFFGCKENPYLIRKRDKEVGSCDIYITEYMNKKITEISETIQKVYALVYANDEQVNEYMKTKGFSNKTILFKSAWNENAVEGVEWSKIKK